MSNSPYEKKRRKKSYILSLPEVKTQIGGKEVTVRYDDNAKEIYMLDEKGEVIAVAPADLSGEIQQTSDSSPQNEEMKENAESSESSNKTEDKEQNFFEDLNLANQANEKDKNKGFAKKIAFVVALAVVLGGIACFVSALKQYRQRLSQQDNLTETSQSAEGTETKEETTEESSVETTGNNVTCVLVTKTSMLPGAVLSAEDFELVEMDTSEYKMLAANGGIYTAAELDRLEGLVVNTYVAADQYLSYESVSNSYVVANPWGRTDELQSTLTLKIEVSPDNLTSCLWGNLVDLKILVETKYTTTNTQISDEVLEAAGVQHQNSTVESTVIDTFVLEAVLIVDTLNANKESLFSAYSSYAAIPVVFREDELTTIYEEPSVLDADIPCYITIAVTSEQAALINALSTDSMTVTFSDPSSSISTDIQSSVYTASQEIGTMIAKLWQVREEAK